MCNKVSETIKQSCCGTLLNINKPILVKEVQFLESKIMFLENQLQNALDEIERLRKREG